MTININDLRYMRGGSVQKIIHSDEISTFSIDQRSNGKASALLMIHGFTSTPAVYRHLLPQLKGYDAIISPPLPGHAQNLSAFAQVRAEDWLDAVYQNCEYLIQNYIKVDVMGFSLGGLLAYELSQRYRLNHLYLLAPALDLRYPLRPCLMLLKLLNGLGFSALYNSGANILSKQYQDIAYRSIPITVLIELFNLIKNFHFKPATCPTDLFLGKHDEVVDVELVAQRFLHDPKVNVHWLNNSAHLLPLDSDLENIKNCINQKNTVC